MLCPRTPRLSPNAMGALEAKDTIILDEPSLSDSEPMEVVMRVGCTMCNVFLLRGRNCSEVAPTVCYTHECRTPLLVATTTCHS